MSTVLYTSGFTADNIPLIGGIWKLWSQEGFPVEMSHLIAKGNGHRIDWLEAMADASLTDECPALMRQLEQFLDESELLRIKMGFVLCYKRYGSYDAIMAEKRRAVA